MSLQVTGLRSTVHDDGRVVLSLESADLGEPGPDEVVIRVEASPINPSDLGVLLAGANPGSVEETAPKDGRAGLQVSLSAGALAAVEGRIGKCMPVGNEGAGTVVSTGSSDAARALEGRTVAVIAGGMYATHRKVKAADCLVFPDGTPAADAASSFVNPLTALGMTETMRREGHSALVHTAAASNLGQMLNRICLTDGIELVNIVRRPEQAELLRGQGALHVVDSSAEDYVGDLRAALVATGATIAFDAIGGGDQATTILAAMESALSAEGGDYNRYGSSTRKQLYVYGGLDRSPTVLDRRFGMAWSVGGWLLPLFLAEIGVERADELRARVVSELTTTFASSYSSILNLDQMLDPDQLRAYAAMATGQKALVTPN